MLGAGLLGGSQFAGKLAGGRFGPGAVAGGRLGIEPLRPGRAGGGMIVGTRRSTSSGNGAGMILKSGVCAAAGAAAGVADGDTGGVGLGGAGRAVGFVPSFSISASVMCSSRVSSFGRS